MCYGTVKERTQHGQHEWCRAGLKGHECTMARPSLLLRSMRLSRVTTVDMETGHAECSTPAAAPAATQKHIKRRRKRRKRQQTQEQAIISRSRSLGLA